ncbi:hypothetical protein Enr13x_25490 [Stieleria neptunia]|uniref:Protein kinase domain-containing protein n=1 Tax=Stieleria neptunia TaxID=2527979 RepID=A0A518HPD2_9BACT|nr:hypothetical protein [Stieleria neptunia]QDV42699.1 hypothetical protein Enr13x_25490 [Stieleria neptunia]
MAEHPSAQDSSRPAAATADTSPHGAGIDGLIGWLQRRRESHPTSPLAELIDPSSLPTRGLVELAAVDLIGQRRRGQEIVVEDYLKQFPQLAESDSDVLDLIDAELCVRREQGQAYDAACFRDRFPELADSIEQLIHLEPGPGEINTGEINTGDSLDWDQSVVQRQMTVAAGHRSAGQPVSETRPNDSIDVPIPIKPPEWIVGARCIATVQLRRGRCWLVKGRDSERSDTVAMKVMPLPATLGRTERTRILDICERTSSVTHPSWVAPRIAAINNGHLAVVRPWIFGDPFARRPPGAEHVPRWEMLVRVAFALAAAHRIGATHGSVKCENVIVDHNSNANLIDAASGVTCWAETSANWDHELSKTLPDRIRRDTIGLVGMIAGECLESPDRIEAAWIPQITDGIDFSRSDACAIIGESLQSRLDQRPVKRSWWLKMMRP